MQKRKYYSLTVAILSFFLGELVFLNSKFIYLSFIGLVVLYFFVIRFFSRISSSEKGWMNALILPVFFSLSLFSYILVIPVRDMHYAYHLLYFFNSLFIYFYFRSIYFFYVVPASEKISGLFNISSFGNFLSFFFLASLAFSLKPLINANVWILVAVIGLAAGILLYNFLLADRIFNVRIIFFAFLFFLIFFELSLALFYLPLNYNISGLVIATHYYALSNMTRIYLTHGLDERIVKRYVLLTIAIIVCVLLTARWS